MLAITLISIVINCNHIDIICNHFNIAAATRKDVSVAQLKWLEKPNFHNRRSTPCGKSGKNSICLKGRTKSYDVLPFRQVLVGISTVGRRFALTYGYEN